MALFVAHNAIPQELPEHQNAEIEQFQALSMEERARRLDAVCAAAMDIYRARLEMGLPVPEPEPWPPSTSDVLRRSASGVRAST